MLVVTSFTRFLFFTNEEVNQMHSPKSLRVSNESIEQFRNISKKLNVSNAILFEVLVKEFLRKEQQKSLKKGA